MSEFNKTSEFDNGSVSISDSVLKTIANIATGEIGGVSGLSGGIAEDFAEMLGKKSFMKGVRIENHGNSIELNLSIIVNYGVVIPELACAVQSSVKQALESMTGLVVNAVNIEVAEIIMPIGEKTEK